MTEERIDQILDEWWESEKRDLKELIRAVATEARNEAIDEALEALTKTKHSEFRPTTIYIDLAQAATLIAQLKERARV